MKKVIKKDDKDNGEAISSQLRMKKRGLREDVFNIKELILNVYVLGGIC